LGAPYGKLGGRPRGEKKGPVKRKAWDPAEKLEVCKVG